MMAGSQLRLLFCCAHCRPWTMNDAIVESSCVWTVLLLSS